MPPGTLPRPDRDRGSSARARPLPAAAPIAAPRRSRPCRSCNLAPGAACGLAAGVAGHAGSRQEQLDRTNLEHDLLVAPDLARELDRVVERGAIDDVEA